MLLRHALLLLLLAAPCQSCGDHGGGSSGYCGQDYVDIGGIYQADVEFDDDGKLTHFDGAFLFVDQYGPSVNYWGLPGLAGQEDVAIEVNRIVSIDAWNLWYTAKGSGVMDLAGGEVDLDFVVYSGADVLSKTHRKVTIANVVRASPPT